MAHRFKVDSFVTTPVSLAGFPVNLVYGSNFHNSQITHTSRRDTSSLNYVVLLGKYSIFHAESQSTRRILDFSHVR